MSAATKAALEQAIRDHLDDLFGEDSFPILTGWVLTTASVGADPEQTAYAYEASSDSPHHVTAGLAWTCWAHYRDPDDD